MTSQELKQTTPVDDLPTVSLKALRAGDADAVALMASACRDYGFFKLNDHGIDPDTQDRFLAAMAAFFALPAASKLKVERTDSNPWGYYDRELTKNRQDWKQIFDLGIDQASDTYESRTPWPEEPAGFKEAMLDWYERCEAIGMQLVSSLCETVGLAPTLLNKSFAPVNSSFLRLNYYPVCEQPADAALAFPTEGHLGISHHTDAGAVTVLLQGAVDGLQVMVNEQWLTVKSDPDSLIINIGDMIQVWSNDRYKAPLHRVLANRDSERYSAAFFLNPSFETDCMPLIDLPAHYHPINWGEFRAARAAGDYANIGEEIQISRFRTDS